MEKKVLNKAYVSLVEQTLQERIAAWMNEIDSLNQKIQGVRAYLNTMRNMPAAKQEAGYSTDDTILQTIIAIFQESNQQLLASSDIRDQFRKRTGKELDRVKLRDYLKNSNGVSFQMTGKNRLAKWKMVVNHD